MSVRDALDPADAARQLLREAERSVLRTRNGIRHVVGLGHPRLGTTPKRTVWESGKAQLWRYDLPAVRYREPVLLVHSLVTRSYILDLRPENSLIAHLVEQGLDVYLLDWGIPDAAEAGHTLATYVDEYLPSATLAAKEASGADELSVIGYCLGGVLAALLVAAHPDLGIRNLVTMATPVDFEHLGPVTAMFDQGRLEIDHVLDDDGNVPADFFLAGFRMLKPTNQVAAYANLWQNLWNDRYVESYQAMAQWSSDQIPFPGAAFAETVDKLIRRNLLMSGRFPLGVREVAVGPVAAAHLNVVATQDHIVPVDAATPALELLGAPDGEELRLVAGHVGFIAGSLAKRQTRPAISGWLTRHSTEGAR